jgi:hypothetical protein
MHVVGQAWSGNLNNMMPESQGPDPTYDGNVLASQVQDQIAVLNAAYRSIGFAFALMKTTRTENADWFTNMKANSDQEGAAQNLLHVGGLNTVGVPEYNTQHTQCHDVTTCVRSTSSVADATHCVLCLAAEHLHSAVGVDQARQHHFGLRLFTMGRAKQCCPRWRVCQ